MGLFDEVAGLVGGALGGSAGDPSQQVMNALQSAGIPGVSGLVQHLQQAGLGQQVASWVGSGENQPISATQIAEALGGPMLGSIAAKFGLTQGQASEMLSRVLPGAVDQATPGGTVPDQDS
ncbi:MAG: DUF937 domain-containing protein [Rhodospirillales bacterium]|nr:DUF937 domain-containing protein [Rhodospirillales bacterium]